MAKRETELTVSVADKAHSGSGVSSTSQSKLTYQLISLQMRGVLGEGHSWGQEVPLAGKEGAEAFVTRETLHMHSLS